MNAAHPTLRSLGRVAAGLLLAIPILIAARAILRYDELSYKGHAATLRRWLPLRAARWVGPLLPAACVFIALAAGLPWLATLAIGLAGAEMYAVTFHREAWIGAFEPWWIDKGARPLGYPPRRISDRRLHWIARNLLGCGLPVLLAVPLRVGDPLIALMVATLFWIKFIGHGHSDFEVVHHWDLHCGVLDAEPDGADPSASRRRGSLRSPQAYRAATTWLLGPCFGYLPNLYPVIHLRIHHRENSGPGDLDSPLPYRRTSLMEFGVFALRSLATLAVGARVWSHPNVRPQDRNAMAHGILVYWIAVGLLLWTGSIVAYWLLFMLLHRAVSSTRSQYVWHGLADASDPGVPKTSTIEWRSSRVAEPSATADRVPTPEGEWAFYDNRHLAHHIRPSQHFSTYPADAGDLAPPAVCIDLDELPTFASDLWSRRLDRVVNAIRSAPMTEAEVARLLEPHPQQRDAIACVTETHYADCLDRLLAASVRLATGGR